VPAAIYTPAVNNRDFPLPIADETTAENPWALEQEPTTLIALWPGAAPPTMMEIVAALAQRCEVPPALMQEMPSREGVLWAAAFATSLLEAPIILWVEPSRPLPPGELTDPRSAGCKWVVGAETMLSMEQPYEDYIALMLAFVGAFDPVALLDPTTMRWFEREELSDLAADPPAQPPVEALWTIHAVFNERDRNEPVWLHTHGLWRCGKPELEMLEVPAERQNPAAELLNNVAQLMLETDLPSPGERLQAGSNFAVTVHRWQDLAPLVRKPNSGGMQDREGEDNPHAGMRAVICGDKPHGVLRKRWMWPEEAVGMLETDQATVFKTNRTTRREAELARARWGEFATAFAALPMKPGKDQGHPPAVFLVKAGFTIQDSEPDDYGEPSREHMWFAVQRFRGEIAEGELLNEPQGVAGMKCGDVIEVRRDMVSDWQVMTPRGRFGPCDVPALWRAIDALKRGEGAKQ
jgi:hypothetical protein